MPTISIHTTLAGGDEKALNKARVIASISIHTTLAGGDRKSELEDIIWRTISIHTTLAGGDLYMSLSLAFAEDFNPHHPRGWRR